MPSSILILLLIVIILFFLNYFTDIFTSYKDIISAITFIIILFIVFVAYVVKGINYAYSRTRY